MYNQGYTPQQGRPVTSQGAWYAPPPQPPQASAGKRRSNNRGPSGGGGSPSGGRPRKRRSLKWQFIKFLLIVAVLAGAVAGVYILKTQGDVRPYMNVFLSNVSVDGIDLSGKTWAQGSQEVWNQIDAKQSGWYVRLKNTSGEYKDITAQTLGISFDPTVALAQAWAIGHDVDAQNRKSIFELKEEIEQAQKTTYDFSSAQQSADTTPIDTILQTLEQVAYKSPKSAQIIGFNPDDADNPFNYEYEIYGQQLNTATLKQEILQMVHALESGEILMETELLAPAITVAELEKTVSLRYRAVTPIASASTEARTNNIRIAFDKINGMNIEDGGKFSFNSIVGRRSENNGFYPAIEYAYGLEVMGVGGGVCQASSTVYLAAIQAGMTISKRYPHSNPVSYTELGKDATVSDTKGRELDLAFKNNSGGRIFIAAHVIKSGNSKRNLMSEVRIYGLSLDNVSYELVSETAEVLTKPAEATLVEDKDGAYVTYVDQTKLVSKGRDGSVVDTYLRTLVDGVETERKKVSSDTYPARADRIYVGIMPREGS